MCSNSTAVRGISDSVGYQMAALLLCRRRVVHYVFMRYLMFSLDAMDVSCLSSGLILPRRAIDRAHASCRQAAMDTPAVRCSNRRQPQNGNRIVGSTKSLLSEPIAGNAWKHWLMMIIFAVRVCMSWPVIATWCRSIISGRTKATRFATLSWPAFTALHVMASICKREP